GDARTGELHVSSVELPLSAESKRTLHYAHEESNRLRHRHIGTEHLLLGVLREESSASRTLNDLGVCLDNVRDALAVNGHTPRFYKGRLPKPVKAKITLGIERLMSKQLRLLQGARIGLVCNQASVDHNFLHAADLFHQHPEINITALFGPQHGIRGDVQDNM